MDLGRWQPARPGHIEADARRERYEWLTQVARARGARVVAVGHTRDDQAETILHRILRGTGLRGLSGIPAQRTLADDPHLMLVRPLLRVWRSEIREFLRGLDQPYREDETNAARNRTRSRIRHDLLPKLAAEYNPAVSEALVRLGGLSAAVEREIDRDARTATRTATVTLSPERVVLDHGCLRSAGRASRTAILRHVWRLAGWPEGSMSAERWNRLAAWIANDEIERRVIGARVEVSSEGGFIVLGRLPAGERASFSTRSFTPIPVALHGRTDVPWAGCSIEVGTGQGPDRRPRDLVDFDQVAGGLFIRAPVPGDRFEPLGMGGKTMPLADFLRGRRVPRQERSETPLVCDERGIVWVAGHRIAERVKATDRTERVLALRRSPRPVVPAGAL
jgi:tRNA(Ile)-lysidine synthase